MSNDKKVGSMEKHARTILTVLIAGMCLWIVNTLQLQTVQTAVLGVKMDSIHLDIAELKDNSKTYVTLEVVKDAHTLINHRIDQLNLQVRAVELNTPKTGS